MFLECSLIGDSAVLDLDASLLSGFFEGAWAKEALCIMFVWTIGRAEWMGHRTGYATCWGLSGPGHDEAV